MEFCGMKRESDRKCLNHARVHANAQSFDRCKALTLTLALALWQHFISGIKSSNFRY